MRDVYLNMIVDIIDPDCEFIEEMDNEIRKYGALVYNHEYNSYQYIREFAEIDYKKELLPDFMKVEDAGELLKGINLTIHYEFDPDTEDDPENIEVWEELSQIETPVFKYNDDGDIELDKMVKLYPSNSKHTIWFLTKEGYQFMANQDWLMIKPVIKNTKIIQTLVKQLSYHPFKKDTNQA